jgi:hypothetical protein
MLVDVRSAVRIVGSLIVQAVDVPELCGGRMRVEEVVDSTGFSLRASSGVSNGPS